MLYLVVVSVNGTAERFVVDTPTEERAIEKVTRFVGEGLDEDAGIVTRRLSDFLADLARLPDPAELDRLDGLVGP